MAEYLNPDDQNPSVLALYSSRISSRSFKQTSKKSSNAGVSCLALCSWKVTWAQGRFSDINFGISPLCMSRIKMPQLFAGGQVRAVVENLVGRI